VCIEVGYASELGVAASAVSASGLGLACSGTPTVVPHARQRTSLPRALPGTDRMVLQDRFGQINFTGLSLMGGSFVRSR
jgi:hypothetical protein